MDREIMIVSGLPRSGTSLMMRMLEAGGLKVLVDHFRKADEDNPYGYYEYEKVKKIKEDSSWLAGARGRVFKMVSMLLRDLPPGYVYRILFMKRELDEVIASQEIMLKRLGKAGTPGNGEKMKELFENHLVQTERWLEKQENMETLYVSYNDVLERPRENVDRIMGFLGRDLDAGEMLGVIDPSLYRNRHG